nr:XRE family transcriptional regulator [Micromonospora sp. DSM 115978]
MDRRKFLLEAAFTAQTSSAAAFFWVANTDRAPVEISKPGRRRIGASDVESIRRITEAFRSNESRYGGGRTRSTFVHFLSEDVAPLLREGSYSGATARQLFSAVAEAELLGGWMAYDSEHLGLAQQYFVAALRLAHDASDVALAGVVLNAMSHQALHLSRPREAANLSRTAQEAARRSGVGALLSESCLLEANSHAVLGDERSCSTAIHRAERALDRADRSDEPPWISFFDSAYLAARSAHCLRDLGRLPQAERLARQSLDMDPHYTRGKSFNLALLASIKARRGDVEAACSTGIEALAVMSTVHSKRSLRYVEDINTALRPYGASATDSYSSAARRLLARTSV